MDALRTDDPASGDVLIRHALGVMSECVMWLYGMRQLLHSRDVSPSQNVPTIEAVAGESGERCSAVARLFASLRAHAPTTRLSDALGPAQAAATATTRKLAPTFRLQKPGKLAAAERIAFGHAADELGAQMQALRTLAEIAYAAVDPRYAAMTLGELTRGHWTRPMFVSREVDLYIARADSFTFQSDPRIVWGLLLRHIDAVVAAGIDRPLARISPRNGVPSCGGPLRGAACYVLSVGDDGASERDTIDRVTLQLAPAIEVADAVLDAAAEIVGIGLCPPSNRQLLSMALAAA